jgi:hypothetical protein
LKAIAGTLCIAALTGCASFTTTQEDWSYEKGLPTRKVTTTAHAYTVLAGKSALANWKASQTDKTQGASVGSLSQETDSSKLLEAAVGAAVKAALTK